MLKDQVIELMNQDASALIVVESFKVFRIINEFKLSVVRIDTDASSWNYSRGSLVNAP